MARKIVSSLVLAVVVFHFTISALGMEPKGYFGVKAAANVTWTHRVNLATDLHKALENKDVHMIEADVRYQKTADIKQNLTGLIMSHDVNQAADLTLGTFLDKFKNETINKKKGLKLDFKNKEVLEIIADNKTALDTCKQWGERPFFLNADILQGPEGSAPTSGIVESLNKVYIGVKECKPIMSVGWTTRATAATNETYTDKNIEDMKSSIATWGEYEITFAMRAGVLSKTTNTTVKKLKELLDEKKDKRSVTVWDSKDDSVDDVKLKGIINELDSSRVYLDVSEDLRKKLNPTKTGGATMQSVSTLMVLGSLALSTLFSKML